MADTIASVQTFILDAGPRNIIFVKLVTSDGVIGWGECYNVSHRERAITSLVGELSYYLKGRELFWVKHFTQAAFADVAIKRGSMDFFCAVSGIEIAMWDAIGKSLNQPVYNLLGGPVRGKFRVYANGWLRKFKGTDAEIEDAVKAAKAQVANGFTALKFDPFPDPWRPYIDRADEETAARMVGALREAVGPKVDLLIEAHRRLAPMTAIRAAERLKEFHPFWYEEPVASTNISQLAEVRRASAIPVVSGEELYTKPAFADLLAAKAADIINPDVTCCCGILQLTEIAAMADAQLVAVAPHNNNSTSVGLAATIHASATMPNFLITEFFVDLELMDREIAPKRIVLDKGYVNLPTAPGLGIEIDEVALAKFVTDNVKPRHKRLKRPDEEGQ